MFCKPARLRNACNELQMLSFQRTAKAAGHEKIITRSSATARCRAEFLNKSDYTHRNRDWPRCIARFATDNAHLEAVCSSAQPAIKRSHPRDFGLLGNNKRNQRELGHG